MDIDLYEEKDKKEYNNFLLKYSNSHVFHTLEWKNVIERTFKIKPFYLVAKDYKNKIRAILPFFYSKNLLKRYLISLPWSEYGGFIGEKKNLKALIEKAIELKQELKCKYILIRQPPTDKFIERTFEHSGFKKKELRVKHIIGLFNKNKNILWTDLNNKNRNTIRKAIKNNVVIDRLVDREELDKIQKLELNCAKRLGLFNPSINYYENIWDELFPKKYLEILIAKHENEIIGFGIFFTKNKKFHHIHLGYNQKARRLGANNYLLWNALERSQEQGYEFFDLGNSAIDIRGKIHNDFKGIYYYKNSFNTSNIRYNWFFYPEYRLSFDSLTDNSFLSNLTKRIVKKIPYSILDVFGTIIIRKFI
jgi:lipid II:glycine glycyltransferase (peptidoglycan interpeptide bridge formation enzyme)